MRETVSLSHWCLTGQFGTSDMTVFATSPTFLAATRTAGAIRAERGDPHDQGPPAPGSAPAHRTSRQPDSCHLNQSLASDRPYNANLRYTVARPMPRRRAASVRLPFARRSASIRR